MTYISGIGTYEHAHSFAQVAKYPADSQIVRGREWKANIPYIHIHAYISVYLQLDGIPVSKTFPTYLLLYSRIYSNASSIDPKLDPFQLPVAFCILFLY